MHCVSFSKPSFLDYKRRMRELEKGLVDFWLEFTCIQTLIIQLSADVGYYSGGGPNHFKNPFSDYLSDKNWLFIAASYPRGADHVVGSNSTPTIYTSKNKPFSSNALNPQRAHEIHM